MFEFRIIETETGIQVIRNDLKTPYNALTPLQMAEYLEVDAQLAIMERMERKAKREAKRQRRHAGNLIYRLACLIGLV